MPGIYTTSNEGLRARRRCVGNEEQIEWVRLGALRGLRADGRFSHADRRGEDRRRSNQRRDDGDAIVRGAATGAGFRIAFRRGTVHRACDAITMRARALHVGRGLRHANAQDDRCRAHERELEHEPAASEPHQLATEALHYYVNHTPWRRFQGQTRRAICTSCDVGLLIARSRPNYLPLTPRRERGCASPPMSRAAAIRQLTTI